MTLGELIAQSRVWLDDAFEPYLVSTDDLTTYLNEAEVEAARRARLLIDSQTTALCSATVTAGDPWVVVDPRVIYLRRVKLASRYMPLMIASYLDMDENVSNWEAHAANTNNNAVIAYMPDLQSGKIRLYRIPAVSDTMAFTVVREPLAPMTDAANDSPEILARYHRNLCHWACYRVYMSKDTELYSPKEAGEHLAAFEAEFGTRDQSNANEEEYQRKYRPDNATDGTY